MTQSPTARAAADWALARVPEGARNRNALALLLEAVAGLKESAAAEGLSRRLCQVVSLLAQAEKANDAQERRRLRAAVSVAVNTARNYARRHGLKPDTRRDVLQEARAILEAMLGSPNSAAGITIAEKPANSR